MKKEKPLIQHPTDPLSTQTELPVPQPLFDDRSMNLSEKEIIDLFEKMMVSFVFLSRCISFSLRSPVALHNSSVSLFNKKVHTKGEQSCCWRWEECRGVLEWESLKSIFYFNVLLPTDLCTSPFFTADEIFKRTRLCKAYKKGYNDITAIQNSPSLIQHLYIVFPFVISSALKISCWAIIIYGLCDQANQWNFTNNSQKLRSLCVYSKPSVKISMYNHRQSSNSFWL